MKTILAALLAVGLSSAAYAADLPVKPKRDCVARSSVDGRYVTFEYARRYPRHTYVSCRARR